MSIIARHLQDLFMHAISRQKKHTFEHRRMTRGLISIFLRCYGIGGTFPSLNQTSPPLEQLMKLNSLFIDISI